MITPEQGNIVLVPFPYSNLADFKTRPALVISNAYFYGKDAILCGITSKSSRGNEISLSNGDLENGRLPVASYIKAGKIFTLEKLLIKKIVAKISAKKMHEVAVEMAKILKPM